MADEKLNTGPAENTSPEAAEPITTPEQAAASEPQQEQTGPAIPEPGDAVVSFDKINELMAEKRQNVRAEVEKAETPETPEAAATGETPQPANTEEPKKPRRGRPPKAEKAATENQKAEKSAGARKGRPPKADKTVPDKPKPSKRDKVSRSDGKAPDAKEPIKPAQDTLHSEITVCSTRILPATAAAIFAARPSSNWTAVWKISSTLLENPSRRSSGKPT